MGGFFRNTISIPYETCEVCSAPVASYQRCYRCHDARQWGDDLADVVLPLAYAYRRSDDHRAAAGRHQSEQHMWSYKNDQPGPGCVSDLTLMLAISLHFHHACVVERVGTLWQSWAVIPSSRRDRPGEHPLVRLAHGAGLGAPDSRLSDRAHLGRVGGPSDDREIRDDRFVVLNPEMVVGRHVLLIEDTWVTGASVQSAAVTMKRAGASAVTILCLARWVREDGRAGEREFFAGLTTPYDALICPLSGEVCDGPYRAIL